MFVAIDVGGTKIRISAYSALDPKTQTLEMKHDTTRVFDQDMQNILGTLSTINNIEYIGLAVPGINIDPEKGIVLAPNLPDWNNKDIKEALANILPREKIFIAHDAVSNALGEFYFSDNKDPFIYISWGTGVGAAYLKSYGEYIHIQQIEFGRQIVNGVPLEDLVGGINFPKNFNGKTGHLLDDNDWKILIDYFSSGLSNLYAFMYAPRIIWGGGVSIKQSERLEPIVKAAGMKYPYLPMPVSKISSFGEWSGVVGALGNIKHKLETSQTLS